MTEPTDTVETARERVLMWYGNMRKGDMLADVDALIEAARADERSKAQPRCALCGCPQKWEPSEEEVERAAEAIWSVLWPTTRPMAEVRDGPMYTDKVGFALDSARAAFKATWG